MYFDLYLKNIANERMIDKNSAIGFATQTPVIPKRDGNTNKHIIMKTNERVKDSNAEINPLFSAVNIPLVKILNPTKSNEILKILFPEVASWNTGELESVNIETNGFVNMMDIVTEINEITPIIFKLVLVNFVSLSLLFSPK